ncbi:MAG TPA: hypothetical protein VI111_10560, partial [Thermoleophilaceae bacterium]
MVIGVTWVESPGGWYRAIYPLRMLEKRGHEILWPPEPEGSHSLQTLLRCDVVLVYRRADDATRAQLERLTARGIPIVWDNDDDLAKLPKEDPDYAKAGGIHGQRIHHRTVKAARLAHTVTTTTHTLADKYRRAGIDQIEVLGNYVPGKPRRRRRRHDGVVIGWVAGLEHRADAQRLKLARMMREVLAAHPEARVECIGVDLSLPERYVHDTEVHFRFVPDRIAAWDIGIAPLADIPFNHARSDIKVKEYAASGIPWLASPLGPYSELGEQQGGRLV